MKKMIALILTLLPLTLLAQEWRCDEHDWLAQNVPSDTEVQELNRKKRNADGARGAAVPKRKTVPKPKPVDIGLVVDSAMILADNYAEAVVNKPEMVKSRMNAIKRFYAPYSTQKPVADSICSSIYNVYVDNIERENVVRANAFKDCFLAIADKDNENLGPLYATELVFAQEQSDTAGVHRVLPLLADYADRNGFDYSSEIETAKQFVVDFEKRKPINEDIVGVWVGESICHDVSYTPSFGEMFVTDLDENNQAHNDLLRATHVLMITDNEVVPIFGESLVRYCEFPLVNYEVPQDSESLDNFRKKKSFYFDQCKPSGLLKEDYFEGHPQFKEYDEKSRSAYFLWANDELHGFNPEYYATLRQSMQNTHASAMGELSRSHVKSGTKVKGQLISGVMYTIGNSILDRLAVSTARSWVREMTLSLTGPTAMQIWIHLQFNVAKSNSNRVSQKDSANSTLYLKWEPEDNVFFLRQNGNRITLGEETKAQKKANKELVKQEKRNWEETFGKIGMSRKKYDEFRRWFNTQMFNQLKKSKL